MVITVGRRDVYNKNEKAVRNREIFNECEQGTLLVDVAHRYGLSVPRIHRIYTQEENKVLKEKVTKLSTELQICRRR